jgi:hypothetical protein
MNNYHFVPRADPLGIPFPASRPVFKIAHYYRLPQVRALVKQKMRAKNAGARNAVEAISKPSVAD